MTLENIGTDTGASAAEPQNTGHENRVPQSRLNEVIKEREDLKARLDKLEQQQQQADEKRLTDQEQFKELAEKYRAELEALKPVAGQVKDWQKSLMETAQAQIERLPKDMRELVPEYDDPRKTLDWLNKNAARLMRPSAPEMDAGARGDTSTHKNVNLTPGEEAALKAAPWMTREDYIAAKISMGLGQQQAMKRDSKQVDPMSPQE